VPQVWIFRPGFSQRHNRSFAQRWVYDLFMGRVAHTSLTTNEGAPSFATLRRMR
jgi:hypothetical protein